MRQVKNQVDILNSKASTPVISDLEENLYNKWVEIFTNKIKENI